MILDEECGMYAGDRIAVEITLPYSCNAKQRPTMVAGDVHALFGGIEYCASDWADGTGVLLPGNREKVNTPADRSGQTGFMAEPLAGH